MMAGASWLASREAEHKPAPRCGDGGGGQLIAQRGLVEAASWRGGRALRSPLTWPGRVRALLLAPGRATNEGDEIWRACALGEPAIS